MDEIREALRGILSREIRVKDTIYGEKHYYFVSETIDKILFQKINNGYSIKEMIEFFEKIDRETQRVAVVRKEGELPDISFAVDIQNPIAGEMLNEGYKLAQQDMVNNRWVQEVDK